MIGQDSGPVISVVACTDCTRHVVSDVSAQNEHRVLA